MNNTKLENKVQELIDKSLTNGRPLVITDTDVNEGVDAYAIYAISDATFTTLDNESTGDTLIGQTLTAGHIWYLPIKGTVTLAGGAVIVYQNNILGE